MDHDEPGPGHRTLQFLGLRDEELSVERRRRRARWLGVFLLAVGFFLIGLGARQDWSPLQIVYGAGFLIVGTGSLVQASRLR